MPKQLDSGAAEHRLDAGSALLPEQGNKSGQRRRPEPLAVVRELQIVQHVLQVAIAAVHRLE